MRKLFWHLGLLTFMIVSCSDDTLNDSDFLVGDTFTNSKLRVVQIDTMTVETSTMKYDSINTTQSSRLLIGKYNDPTYGTVQSSSYMGILPSAYTIDLEAKYDSLALYLKYDKYYYNDTLQSNTIHIKRLKEKLEPENDEYFYNTSSFEYYEDDLGSLQFYPRPLEADTLEIKLNDNLGIDLFEQLQDQVITTSDEFKDYFKGITIVPDSLDQGTMLGFSTDATASFIRLYFSVPEEEERLQSYIDFTLNTSDYPNPCFNRIISEDPINYIKSLTGQEVNLSSLESNNQSYIQSGLGITTRIEFPHIKSLYDINGDGTILNATLKIKPAYNTYNNQLILRDTLAVYVVDKNNDLIEQLIVNDLSILAILNRDNQEFDDIHYEISLGNYIEEIFLAENDTDEALILLPEDYNSSVDRFVLGGGNTSENLVSLELTYAIYDEN